MENNSMKKCCRCGIEKNLSEFHKMKSKIDGLRPECKVCRKKGTSKEKVKEQNKKYYKENKDKEDSRCKIYRSENKEKIKKKHAEYSKNNRKLKNEYRKKYRVLNREKLSRINRAYIREKKKNNIQFKISMKIRGRIYNAIKRQSGEKAISAIELLGCTIDECRKYIESQFTKGMTWENHSLFGWHIDHKKPCALFDLTDQEQQKKCFHYTNLQPLWAKDNLKKGSIYV